MAGQYLGAFLAALLLWGEYADVIKLAEATQVIIQNESCDQENISFSLPRTRRLIPDSPSASLDLTLPSQQKRSPLVPHSSQMLLKTKVTTVSLAMDQMLGTALLLLIILAVTDEENMKIISSLVPVIIGLGLSAIHLRWLPTFGLLAWA